ncbi:MAG TPA: type II 3-dehydroquinate dehydratase [Myxococcaceae bacterium]|nr:type II 3-dehydroquinate dehydratase [Myxococcaceae bacterium]
MNVLVLHGPTLQFLGQRQGDPPGLTLAEVDRRLAEKARALGHVLRTVQSNHEGALVDALWEQRAWAEGVVLNPGPLAPGSHVLRAAVSASRVPVVEVLLAPAKGRAAVQRRSLLKDLCAAHVAGTGAEAYLEALERLSRAASRAVAARTQKTLGRAPEVARTRGPKARAEAAGGGGERAAARSVPATAAPSAARTATRSTPSPTPAAPPAPARPAKTLGPARAEGTPREPSGREPVGAARAGSSPPAGGATSAPPTGKTLGRAAVEPTATRRPGAGLTRAEVRARIADRLGGRLTPSGLATWARGEWVALQRGAAVEAGQRDQLEEVLQALFLAVQPKGALSDHQLVEWMAALE